MEVVVVPWTAGPLIHIAGGLGSSDDLRCRSGVPIDLTDPDVADLVDAYEHFWAGAPSERAAITVAHNALLETASLLRCAGPAGPAEQEYVRRRRRAIAALAAADPVGFLTSL